MKSSTVQLRRMALAALGWIAAWTLIVAGFALLAAPAPAHAMTAADVPTVPANAVEVCDHHMQALCPIVTTAAPLFVTAPNTIASLPDLSGRIVRFEPINGEMGAWVQLTRGGELYYPLRSLTLAGAR